jgi:hypothetical protein
MTVNVICRCPQSMKKNGRASMLNDPIGPSWNLKYYHRLDRRTPLAFIAFVPKTVAA